MPKPTAIVYIDGLNLYHRLLESRPHLQWINLVKLCEEVLPSYEVKFVRYFTSVIKGDPELSIAQQIYFSALARGDKRLTLHLGRMISSTRNYPIQPMIFDGNGERLKVKVVKVEEKESDVTLVLLSSDTDFAGVLRFLKSELNARLGLISPNISVAKIYLDLGLDFIRALRVSALEKSQFPEVVESANANLARPKLWFKN